MKGFRAKTGEWLPLNRILEQVWAKYVGTLCTVGPTNRQTATIRTNRNEQKWESLAYEIHRTLANSHGRVEPNILLQDGCLCRIT